MTMGIYELRHVPSGRVYIGSSRHIDKRWKAHRWALDNNCHANERLQGAWAADGPQAFIFTILQAVDDLPALFIGERHYIAANRATDPEFGFNLHGAKEQRHVRPEVSKQRSEMNRARWADPAFKARVREAISKAKAGVSRGPHADATREKIAQANRARAHLQVGVPLSEETRAKMSAVRVGTTKSPETRARIAAGRTGKKHSPETLAKMSAAAKRRKLL